jgi:hypothetical protein
MHRTIRYCILGTILMIQIRMNVSIGSILLDPNLEAMIWLKLTLFYTDYDN